MQGYQNAVNKNKLTGNIIDKPNDLLGLSYVKEIIKNKYNIKPISIKRSNDYHGKEINSNIISANLIRKILQDNGDISSFVPKITERYVYKNISINKAFNLLKRPDIDYKFLLIALTRIA